MNKQHEALYDAITGIDAEYIEESTRPPRRTQNRILRFTAAAAVLALLLTLPGLFPSTGEYVTIPGVLTVTAYVYQGGSDFKEIPMESSIVSSLFNDGYCPVIINSVPGHPITFQIPEGKDVSLKITVSEGHLYDWNKDISDGKFIRREEIGFHSQTVTLTNTMTLYWMNTYDDPDNGNSISFIPQRLSENSDSTIHNGSRIENIYLDVVIYTEGHITGYTVLHIKPVYDGGFQLVLKKAKAYPQVDGEYQDITQEFIEHQIQAAK